jgi:predicted dehydrogenase
MPLEPKRVLIIGKGKMGSRHEEKIGQIPTIALLGTYGRNYATEIHFLKVADGVDGIIIASPASKHLENLLDAMERFGKKGYPKPVFLVEKPLFLSLEEFKKYEDATRKYGNPRILIGLQESFSTSVSFFTELAKSNIGHLKGFAAYRINQMPKKSEIGAFYDLSPHDFSILYDIIKKSGLSQNPENYDIFIWSWKTKENILTEAIFNIIIDGIPFHFDISWEAQKRGGKVKREWQMQTDNKGTIALDLIAQTVKGEKINFETPKEEKDVLMLQARHFSNLLRGEELQPRNDIKKAQWILELQERIKEKIIEKMRQKGLGSKNIKF